MTDINHHYARRHPGHMPETDAIRRADTVREIRHINPAYIPSDLRKTTPAGRFWLAYAAAVAVVVWVLL